MEVYKIDLPFGSSLLLRALHFDKTLEGNVAELERKYRLSPVVMLPSLEYDFRLEYTSRVSTAYALCLSELFVASVLGYPKGEYSALTPEGVRCLKPSEDNIPYGKILVKCKQLLQFSLELDGSDFVLFDYEAQGGVYRLAPCHSCHNFDMDSVGNALLRYPGERGAVRGVASISSALSPGSFDTVIKLSPEGHSETAAFALLACASSYLCSLTSSERIELITPRGRVYGKKLGAGSLLLETGDCGISRLVL